ncbi:MAG: hypothetical protein KGQ49_00055 [Verrucomicrobia bacterium]|nr:hypothetical protein [Verrucomicrobiota bacterium]MBU6445771.1 hypothetical protein [Verrucomicrobiota bacterium]MDE3046808.1 hypothetical protein [Verrucomicrobiota bacterium]
MNVINQEPREGRGHSILTTVGQSDTRMLTMNFKITQTVFNEPLTATNTVLRAAQKTAYTVAAVFTALAETLLNVFAGLANLVVVPALLAARKLNKEVAEQAAQTKEEPVEGVVMECEPKDVAPVETPATSVEKEMPATTPARVRHSPSKLRRIASGTARLVASHPVKTAALVASVAAGYYLGVDGIKNGINDGMTVLSTIVDICQNGVRIHGFF